MTSSNWNASQFERRQPRIAVVGDIMIDVDLHCACTRLSQDGPWPVMKIERTERRLGGAGNVARMASALGASTLLLGLVGRDDVGQTIDSEIESGVQVVDGATTTKTRLWVNGDLIGPRIDQDLMVGLTDRGVEAFARKLSDFDPQAIVVADHGKGVVTTALMDRLGRLGVPVYVDPLRQTPIPFTPAAVAGGAHELGVDAGRAECVIEKRGPLGLVWKCATRQGQLDSTCRKIVDPLGAGDQFISALAYQRVLGLDWIEAIEWANLAAGLQCERPGCQPLTLDEIEANRELATVEGCRD